MQVGVAGFIGLLALDLELVRDPATGITIMGTCFASSLPLYM